MNMLTRLLQDRHGERWSAAACNAFHSSCMASGGPNESMTPAGGSTFSVPVRGLQPLYFFQYFIAEHAEKKALSFQ